MATHLLVVLLDGASLEKLKGAVEQPDGEQPAVYLVAPTHVGGLHWLASDEDGAHAAAASRVLEAEWVLGGLAELGGESAESDPALAVADALEHFPAEEIVVVGSGVIDPQLYRALRAFALPVTLWGVEVGPDSFAARLRGARRGFGSGRNASTPFVAMVAANVGLLLIALVGALVAALIVWAIQTF
jgi:hypothetical protein